MSKFLDKILMRLSGVKKIGDGKYMAICPAHDDKSPSLAITEKDGKCLLHCFPGCSALDVLGSIGLEMGDLFDDDGLVRSDSDWSEKHNARLQSQQIWRARKRVEITTAIMSRGEYVSEKEIKQAKEAKRYLTERGMI